MPKRICQKFTFHNVSINSNGAVETYISRVQFTFHNVSINSMHEQLADYFCFLFTFHNVSINSKKHLTEQLDSQRNLHSIMYLLIRVLIWYDGKLQDYLHSIMYLLILNVCGSILNWSYIFTFHNVSINSFPP